MNSNRRKLPRKFFIRPAKILAPDLLGKIFCVNTGKVFLSGRIAETESYPGIKDPASHSYKNKHTARNDILYRPGGLLYVYSIYGIYFCCNIVAGKKNDPQAVFIRALEPLEGIDTMKKNYPAAKSLKHLANGPCKWTKSFGINKSFTGEKAYGSKIYVLDKAAIKRKYIKRAKRIGVDYAGSAKNRKLRFYIKNNCFISKA